MNVRNHKVLLVEDKDPIRRLVQLMLADYHLEILEASNGRQAIRLLELVRPGMMFLDRMLPDTDGVTLCRRAKALDPNIYVVMLTARGGDDEKQLAKDAGADAYVVKPFEEEQLIEQVRIAMPDLGHA